MDHLVGQTVADVVRLLAAVVDRLRTPLLIVALAPAVPGLILIVVSVLRGGPDVPWAFVVTGVGLVPSGGLAVRRRQLVRALQPPAEAAAQVSAAISSPVVWAQLKGNLGPLVAGAVKVRPGSLGRRIWHGVKLGADLRNRVGGSPRFAPFLPGRLRELALLTLGCLVCFGGLAVLAVVKTILSGLGIG